MAHATLTDLCVRGGLWTAVIAFGDQEAQLTSELDEEHHDRAAATGTFHHVAAVVAASFPGLVRAATEDLHALYNTTWREDDAPLISEAEFAATLSLSAVGASDPENPSRGIDVWMSCGDLFAGHFLQCLLAWDGQPRSRPRLVG